MRHPWTIDPEGSLAISAMVTEMAGALPFTTSRLQQSVGDALDRIGGHLQHDAPHAQHLLPEALQVHADRLCVPHQVAAILSRDLEDVCDMFDDIMTSLYDPAESPLTDT